MFEAWVAQNESHVPSGGGRSAAHIPGFSAENDEEACQQGNRAGGVEPVASEVELLPHASSTGVVLLPGGAGKDGNG